MFWKDTIERVIRTMIQVAAAAVLVLWVDAGSFSNIDWSVMWQVAVYASGLSLLMAIAGKSIGDNPDSGSVLSSGENA